MTIVTDRLKMKLEPEKNIYLVCNILLIRLNIIDSSKVCSRDNNYFNHLFIINLLFIFADPEEILKEETGKIPCRKLSNGEECPFEKNCRFSHYSPQMIWELQRRGRVLFFEYKTKLYFYVEINVISKLFFSCMGA